MNDALAFGLLCFTSFFTLINPRNITHFSTIVTPEYFLLLSRFGDTLPVTEVRLKRESGTIPELYPHL